MVADQLKDALVGSVIRMTTELCTEVTRTCWSDPDDVSLADRKMRILYAYERNVEKCLVMTEKYQSGSLKSPADDDEKRKLFDQLVRYANRLGQDELARRLREDRPRERDIRLDPVGPGRSAAGSAED
ncbi:hypothetical protein [Parvularcula sp. LCG005]|uniref:hypothetical protein n=1 Tax=Parvularcula sp. LCG005 TaxID=3078805 RepID=UPI002943C832|nr:hypothetical protein [Parvularcula sp. LCG005]WOI53988.1 hypothetical protein RUI03_03040 [Parvularcula sp. LCG005]